ncbi:response regulator, partial [bacterium]|nr:response regulator [bacterium]
VASQAGIGTCFTVRVPVDVANAPPVDENVFDAVSATSLRLKGLRILAAEDDQVNQWVLRELLQQEGALCTIMDDGIAALAVLSGQDVFDVFLTDVQMPGLNGYDTAQRSLAGLTAYALPEERQRCLDAGMSNHVTKPVDIDTLVAAILRLVKPGAAIPQSDSPSPVPASAPTERVVDWPALEQRLPKAASRQKILESLLENHGKSPALLRSLIDDGDPEPVLQIAHNLRGVAGLLAAPQTQQAAESLENSIRDPRRLERDKVERLADSLEIALTEVSAYRIHCLEHPVAS